MPGVIKILPEHLASKIAAGEVVQRPASVVKELLENSIDAGAKNISVIIKEGGKRFIQVTDDGCGMSREDAVLAFGRHATSKISTYEDLENIRTLGFRGEALYSIAAVAQVELKTRIESEPAGLMVRVEGGEQKEVKEIGMQPGTSVTVKNLFYNTPVRRNFLKNANTEFKHIYDAVQRVALSRPELGLVFLSDDEKFLDLKSAALGDRLKDLFGEKQYEELVPVNAEAEAIRLRGYIGKPDFARKTRTEQFLFLNKRFILNRNLNHAVFSAYEHLLEKGSYPFFLLFLEIDPHRVDVNVHPSKLEVKFEDERNVYRFVLTAVRKSLGVHDLIPSIAIKQETGLTEEVKLHFGTQAFQRREFPSAQPKQAVDWQMLYGERQRPAEPSTEIPAPEEKRDETFRPVVSQLHHKYILTQIDSGLMIVDQHVAHERILYEKILGRIDQKTPRSQQLLFPQTIQLTYGDYALVEEILAHLEQFGFSIKLFGKNTIVVEGVPSDVPLGKETRIFQDLLDAVKENEHEMKLDARDHLAKTFACKAAVKAGDLLNENEMRHLITELFTTKMPYACPHGRPIVLKISVEELDKRFGRK